MTRIGIEAECWSVRLPAELERSEGFLRAFTFKYSASHTGLYSATDSQLSDANVM